MDRFLPEWPRTHVVTASVAEIVDSVLSGERTAHDHVETSLDAAIESQERLNAFISIDSDLALARASEIDRQAAAGEAIGPLAGVPIALKDLIDHAGRTTTCGSSFYRHAADKSATVVDRLEAAGAVIIGRTGLHEFAYGFSSENDWFGPVHNPYDQDLSPGGSSGGSAAAVGAGIVPVAIGTDTGGSVRVPAALCGSVGLKVTHGCVPLLGVFPLAESLDTVGPITRTVSDARLLFDVMRGQDVADPWSRTSPRQSMEFPGVAGMKIVIPMDWLDAAPVAEFVLREIDSFAAALTELGADVSKESLPDLVPDPLFGVLAAAEAANVHREWFPQLDKRYGTEVEARLAVAMDVTLDNYLEARRWQAGLVGAIRTTFDTADLLLTPAVGHPRKKIGQSEIEIDGAPLNYRPALSTFSGLVNATGCPAITLPLNRPGTPPPSIQFIAPRWGESTLLGLGEALEGAGVVAHRPPVATGSS